MKLMYRGQNYDYQPTATELNGQELAGKYRGRNMTFRNIKQTPAHEVTHELTYRGVHFNG